MIKCFPGLAKSSLITATRLESPVHGHHNGSQERRAMLMHVLIPPKARNACPIGFLVDSFSE